jgi:hypothetical protein
MIAKEVMTPRTLSLVSAMTFSVTLPMATLLASAAVALSVLGHMRSTPVGAVLLHGSVHPFLSSGVFSMG